MTDFDQVACDAERAVLCGVMWGGAATLAEVRGIIDGPMFRLPHHETIWNAMVKLADAGAPVGATSVQVALASAGELGHGLLTTEFLVKLTTLGTNSTEAAYYADTVRTESKRRKIKAFAGKLNQAHAETAADDLDEVMAKMLNEMEEIAAFGAATTASLTPHLAALPTYPANEIPGPLGELIRGGIGAGLHPCLVGGAGLGAIGTVTGMSTVEIYPTWTESPSLWIPLIAPPGAGKSPAMSFAFGKLQDLDADSRSEYIAELEAWKEDKCKGTAPADRTRIQEDVTTEAVARWLAAGDGTGAMVADELTNWLRGLGRYQSGSDGGNRARWLSNWALRPWPYVRVTGGVNLMVRRPVVTICGGIQNALHQLLGPEDDGFRVRWLPHIAPLDTSLKPQRGRHDVEGWNKAIERLYHLREPRTWTLGDEDEPAFKVWSDARERWKRQASKGTESTTTTGALVKADIQAARVALAIAESMDIVTKNFADRGRGGVIPEEAMTGAVAIVDFSLNCWRTLPGQQTLSLSRTAETLDLGVDRLAEWLESHGGKANRRELLRAAAGGARTSDDLSALIKRYEARYPGSVAMERSGARGPKSETVYAPRRGAHEDA